MGDLSASTEDILEDDACMQNTNSIKIEVTGQDIQNAGHGFEVQGPRSKVYDMYLNTHSPGRRASCPPEYDLIKLTSVSRGSIYNTMSIG